MLEFVKKNKMFVSMLTVVLVSITALTVIYFLPQEVVPPLVENPPTQDHEEEVPQKEDDEDKTNEDDDIIIPPTRIPMVNSFSGNFNASSETITLNWQYEQSDVAIIKAALYHGDTYLVDVTSNNRYEIPLRLYNFTTGNNVVTLKLDLADGTQEYYETNVFVDYLLSVSLQERAVEDETLGHGILFDITYTYHDITPVGMPIFKAFTNDGLNTQLNATYYMNEEIEKQNAFHTYRTTYFVPTSGDEKSVTWNYRWDFEVVNKTYEKTFTLYLENQLPEPQPPQEEEQNGENGEIEEHHPAEQ